MKRNKGILCVLRVLRGEYPLPPPGADMIQCRPIGRFAPPATLTDQDSMS